MEHSQSESQHAALPDTAYQALLGTAARNELMAVVQDYPELLEWPYLWQQTEYVLGGGTTDYLFLVLAADHLLNLSHPPRG